MPDESERRELMVREQIVARGIADARVLGAMRAVPRERFVPPHLATHAYDDTPLDIEAGQTISQPYIVAQMIAMISPGPNDRVLEVGTGSGYAAAVLSRVVGEVFSMERHAELAGTAARTLRELGYDNVHILVGDGTLGWPEHAPYDAIIVTAGGPRVPEALRQQLVVGGRLVIPVGPVKGEQQLVRVTRQGPAEFTQEALQPVRFVPLVGEEGWSSPGTSDVATPE